MRVIGHDVLLGGAGCCLWTRGFSGRRARPQAVRAATFDRCAVSKPGQAPPPTGTAAHVPRSSAFRFLRHPSDLAHQSRMQFPRDYFKL